MAASKTGDASGLELAPLRSLDDFLLESARFQMPNIKDLEKWGYRVYNNLIYYQSNYFLMALALFILIGFIHPLKMALGLIALGIGCVLFSLACSAGPQVSQFKKDHPLVSVAALLSGVYFIVYLLNSIMVFLFGILLPVSVVFVHASLRMRNIRNKLANKMEQIGVKEMTPMRLILDSLGFEADLN